MKKSNQFLRRAIAASMVLALVAGTGVSTSVGRFIGTTISVSAAETWGDYEYEVNDSGTVTITKYNGSAANVTLPSKIDGKNVAIIGDYAFYENKNLRTVTIPSSIVTIRQRAFQYCENLESVTLSEGLVTLEDAVFEFCYALKSIVIPATVTDVGIYQFQHDKNLASVTLSPNTKYIAGWMFQDCPSLTEITIPDAVETIGSAAFSYCRNLKKVNFGKNTQLKRIDNSFEYSALDSFTLPDSVEEISGWCFNGCPNLKTFAFNDKISYVPHNFLCNCPALTDVYFGKNLESIDDYAFGNCPKLADFHNIPDNYIYISYNAFLTTKWYADTANGPVYFGKVLYNYKGAVADNENIIIPESTVYINENTFRSNTGLKSVTIPAGVKDINFFNIFNNSKNLEAIYIAEDHPDFKSIDGIVYTKDGRNLVYCPKGKTGALVIPDGMEYINSDSLRDCTEITSLTFSKSLRDFYTDDFTTMSSLTAINVPAENESYYSKDGVLYGKTTDDSDNEYPYIMYCYPPAKSGAYTVPNTIEELHWSAFKNASKLTKLTIPKSVRWFMSWENLNNSDSLTAVSIAQNNDEIDYCTADGVVYNKDMTYMYYVPNAKSGVVTIPDTIEEIHYNAFRNCKNITKVNISASVNSMDDTTFDDCTSLQTFTVSNNNETFQSVDGALMRKGDENYLICVPKALTSYTFPDSITHSSLIREQALKNCNALTTLNLGKDFYNDYWWSGHINNIVHQCPNLAAINVDKDNTVLKSIDGVVYQGTSLFIVPTAYEGAFNIPVFVTSCYYECFQNCNKITEINFPASYTDGLDFYMFNNCNALQNISFVNHDAYTTENGVVYSKDKTQLYYVANAKSGEFVIPSNVESIYDYAFVNCHSLTKIVLPDTMKRFECYLEGCSSLKTLIIPTSVTSINAQMISGLSDDFTVEGYAGSYAETFCNEQNITFHRLSDTITLNKTTISTAVGRTAKLTATVKTDNTFDKTVTFESENPKVAKVSSNGTVTAVSAGTVKITAKTTNGKTASCLVTVNLPLENTSTVSNDHILVNDTAAVKAQAQYGTGSYQYAVDYKLSDAANWTSLLKKGSAAAANFTPAAAGTYDVKVTAYDKDGFTAEKVFTVTVNDHIANTSTVSANKTTLGDAVTIHAGSTGGLGGTTYKYEYKLSTDTSWKVLADDSAADSKSFKPSAAGTYNIRVTAKDSGNNTAQKSFTVTVTGSLANTSSVSADKILIGDKVTVNVSATGGISNYSYAYYLKHSDDTKWTTVSDYSSKTSAQITPDKTGNYLICTKVKDQNGTIAKEYLSVLVNDTLKNTSAIAADTIVFGNTFTVNASAADGMGGYTYAVSYKKSTDTNWVVKQDFSSNSTITVKPSKAADYIINVKVKDKNGSVAEKNFNVKVNNTIANVSSVSSDFITLGEMTVITAKATGGMGEKSYKYEYKLSTDNAWTVLSDYSDNAAAIFKPAAAGQYDIRVTVKDSTESASEKTFSVKVADVLTNTSSLSTDAIVVGDSVTITGSAAGGKGDYQYAYFYKKFTQKNWTKIADYTANTTAKATPKSFGNYQICVKAKDKDGTVSTEYLNVVVNDKLKNHSTISAESIVLGDTVTAKAAAADGMGGYTYAVLYKKTSDTKWTTKQDFKANASVSVKPANAATYDICIKVKDSAGTIEKKFFTLDVKAPLANQSTLSADTVSLGNSITVNAKATGGSGDYTYAVLYKKTSDTKWTTKQSFHANASVSIKPANAATYDVCVKVQDRNGTIVKKFFTLTCQSSLQNTSSLSAETLQLGDTLTMTGSAAGGTAPYSYAFYYKKASDSTWVEKQNFDSNNTVSIKPNKAVEYDVCIKVKDAATIEKKYFKVTVQ